MKELDKIREALKDNLNHKRLSVETKQQILNNARKKQHPFIPLASILIVAIAVFLIFTMQNEAGDVNTAISSQYVNVKNLDLEIVDYYNEAVDILRSPDQKTFDRVGDAYLMRLALEKNSGLFYGDSSLVQKERLLISELLHYLQEAIYFESVYVAQLPQISSIEELVEMAPTTISELKSVAEIPFVKVTDELGNTRTIVNWKLGQWLGFALVVFLLLAFIVHLYRKGYRVPPVLFLLILATMVSFLFLPKKNNIVYDETTMVQVSHEHLVEANVRVSSPTLEYAATFHDVRVVLTSYPDGLNALTIFQYNSNGVYDLTGAQWHAGDILLDSAFSGIEDDTKSIQILGFPAGHQIDAVEMTINEKPNYVDTIAIPSGEPAIRFYFNPEAKSIEYKYLNAEGKPID